MFCKALLGLILTSGVALSLSINHVYRNGNATVTVFRSADGRSNIEDGPYGGDGGSAWTDGGDVHLNGPITAMQIRSGERIDAIQVRYGDVWADEHGGSGGGQSMIEMGGDQPGEAGDPLLIDIVNIRHGSKVDELQFISTINGGVHGPYGGGGGDADASSHPGCELEYLSGQSGEEVDNLTFHYVCPDQAMPV